MGDLIRAPLSEITATLEILDRLEVTPHDFEVLRKSSTWNQGIVARIHQADPFLWAMLGMEQTAAEAGFMESDFRKLAGDEDLLRQLLLIIRGQVEVKAIEAVESIFLGSTSTITLSIPAGKFVVRDHFKVDVSDTALVKIFYLGDNFREWVLGKTEKCAGGESTLRLHTLNKNSLDASIIVELGGEAKTETTLAEAFALMKKQGKGKAGTLLNNGYMNIFYIRDVIRVLRTVGVDWYGGGWHVDAYSVEGPGEWYAGNRVLSRNS